MIRLRILLLATLCVVTNMIYAQTPDTQQQEGRVVYDTLFVHDTLHVVDTINIVEYIRSQTFEQMFAGSEHTDTQSLPDSLKTKYEEAVTFNEKLVLNNRDQNDLSMDSIKRIISAGLIVLSMNGVLPAQTDSAEYQGSKREKYPRHEIGVSYGFLPVIGVFAFGEFRTFRDFDDLCPYREHQPIWSGSVNLQYHCYFNKYNALDLDVSWAMYKHHKMEAVENMYAYRSPYLHFISVMLGYSVHYFTTEKISLYSSVYVGGTVYCIGSLWMNYNSQTATYEIGKSPVMTLKGAMHVNILGIRIGKRNAANIELGFGTQGVLKIGYNYQF